MSVEHGMSSAPRDVREQNKDRLTTIAGSPVPDQQRIRYGIITAVNKESSQVKVQLFKNTGSPDIKIENFNPIINSLSQIHLVYGALRKGLLVRFFYRGKEDPISTTRGIVEVIGDEESNFLKRDNKPNVINTGPFKLMSGGLLG